MTGSPLFMRDVTLTLKLVVGRADARRVSTATSHPAEIVPTPGDEVTYATLCPTGSYSSSRARRRTRCTSSPRSGGRRTGSRRSCGTTTAQLADVPVPGARRRRHADRDAARHDRRGHARSAGNYGGEVETYAELDVDARRARPSRRSSSRRSRRRRRRGSEARERTPKAAAAAQWRRRRAPSRSTACARSERRSRSSTRRPPISRAAHRRRARRSCPASRSARRAATGALAASGQAGATKDARPDHVEPRRTPARSSTAGRSAGSSRRAWSAIPSTRRTATILETYERELEQARDARRVRGTTMSAYPEPRARRRSRSPIRAG